MPLHKLWPELQFSIFFWTWWAGLKKYSKNERHLCLVRHSFNKISQNMCLINTHILVYRYARCNFSLWNAPWFYCVFFWVFFIHNWSLNHSIFSKLSRVVCLINVHSFLCQLSKCGCRLWKFLWFNWFFFLEIFTY